MTKTKVETKEPSVCQVSQTCHLKADRVRAKRMGIISCWLIVSLGGTKRSGWYYDSSMETNG